MPAFRHFVTVRTPDGPMPMYLVGPGGAEGPNPKTANDVRLIERPVVLILHNELGAHRFDLTTADRFANEGYVAAVPDLFHRARPCFSADDVRARRAQLNDEQVRSDVDAAIAYLQSQPYINWDKVGILGFSMGGRIAYMMAASNPTIGVAASFYGDGILNQEGGPSPFELTPKIQCPVLLFDGEEDAHADPDELKKVEAELSKHGVHHEVHRYPDAGQEFMTQQSPASEDAWAKLIAGFREHLPPSDEKGYFYPHLDHG